MVLAAYLSARLRDGQATDVLVSASAALTTAAVSVYLALNGALAFGISSDAPGADLARSGFFAVTGDLSFMGFFVLFPLWAAASGFVLLGQLPTDSHAPWRRA